MAYQSYPYPYAGYSTFGIPPHQQSAYQRPAGLGPQNVERKPAYHLVESANRMAQHLHNFLPPMSDMMCRTNEFAVDGRDFSGNFHAFKDRFSSFTNNAKDFMHSVKNPDFNKITNARPFHKDENYPDNIDKDFKENMMQFQPIPHYPCPPEPKCVAYSFPCYMRVPNNDPRMLDRNRRPFPPSQKSSQYSPASQSSSNKQSSSTNKSSSKNSSGSSSSYKNSSTKSTKSPYRTVSFQEG